MLQTYYFARAYYYNIKYIARAYYLGIYKDVTTLINELRVIIYIIKYVARVYYYIINVFYVL